MIVDACFGGQKGRSVLPKGAKASRREAEAKLPPGVAVLAAGRTCGLEGDGGAFTRQLLRDLKERDGDFRAAFDAATPALRKAGLEPTWTGAR